jgi:xanthine dehydrogenase YagS FAD-binding subunit
MLPKFRYARPDSIDGVIRALASDDARVCAGGSDLLGCLHDGVFQCSTVVSLNALEHLRGIVRSRDGVRIGALTRIAEIAANPMLREQYAALAQAAGEVASPQLRNQGTIGGNICQKPRCWYYRGEFHCRRKGGDTCYALAGENQFHAILGGARCYIVHPSDTASALVALEATVQVAGPGGTRSVPAADFFVPPSVDVHRETVLEAEEVVTAVVLPQPARGVRSSYRKVRARGAWDFAMAGVALAIQFDGRRVRQARVVLSGAAPIPWRSREAEAQLVDQALDGPVARQAAAAAVRDAVPLKRNGYKVDLFRGVIEEELQKLASG